MKMQLKTIDSNEKDPTNSDNRQGEQSLKVVPILYESWLKVVPKSQNDEDNVTTKTQLTVIGSGGADKSPRALLTLSCLTLPRSMIQTTMPSQYTIQHQHKHIQLSHKAITNTCNYLQY